MSNEDTWLTADTPCRRNVDVFDSRFLADFDPDDYIEEHPGEELTAEDIHRAEFLHNVAQKNAEIAARDLCGKCPVIDECRAWVLKAESNDPEVLVYGVVAGLTSMERRQIIQKNKILREAAV